MIFDIEGEAGFRVRESAVLLELAALHDIVLATGGGAVVREENRRVLAQNGTVVYLRAAPEDLWQRTRHDKNRPLLQSGDPVAKLQALLAQRDPLYREIADLVIDTGDQSVGKLAHRLEQRLAQRRRESGKAGSALSSG